MKNQVVFFPCDFSALAQHTLQELVLWQGAKMKELIIFHVAARTESSGIVKRKTPDELFHDLKAAIPELDKIPHHFEWVHGISEDQIIQRAHDIQIDWMVMPSKGAKGLEHLWGSRSERILRETSMPAIIIPPKSVLHSMTKIAFATDFQQDINEGMLLPLLDLLDSTGAELDVISVNLAHKDLSMSQRINKRHLKNKLRHLSPSFNTHMHKGAISTGLSDYCKQNQVDMLCIQSKISGGISRLWEESISQSVLLEARLPIMVLK